MLDYHNIHVVYTKEAETADQYIEKLAHNMGREHDVTVATSGWPGAADHPRARLQIMVCKRILC